MTNIKKLTLAAIFVAIIIIFTKVMAIQTPIIRISMSFIPVMFSAIILGPIWAGVIGILADIIGAFLMPMGNFFFGFTISAFLSGAIYGLFLYNKNKDFESDKKLIIRLCLSSFFVVFFVNAILTTLWVSMLYGKAFFVIMPARLTVQCISYPLHIIVVFALYKLLRKPINKFTNR